MVKNVTKGLVPEEVVQEQVQEQKSQEKEITVRITTALGTEEVPIKYQSFEDLVEQLRQVVAEKFEGESGEPELIVKEGEDQIVLATVESLKKYLPKVESGEAELIVTMPAPKSA